MALARLAFKFGNVADILEFGLCLAGILAAFTTEATENVSSFLLAAHLGKPTGRLGEKPDDGQEEDKWYDLERNWEPPDKGPVVTFVEGATTM